MLTMTSLEAQNKFGTLIDASQREPVVVTRRGRPVSVMISVHDLLNLPFSVVKTMSELSPLRGEEAARHGGNAREGEQASRRGGDDRRRREQARA